MPKKGYKQTEEHRNKLFKNITGSKNPNWKGGRTEERRLRELEYKRNWFKNWRRDNPELARFQDHQKKMKRRRLLVGEFTFGEWENLKKQYGFRCPCCLQAEPKIKLTIDHVIPVTKGGSNYIENIQPLCHSCNSQKRTKVIRYE